MGRLCAINYAILHEGLQCLKIWVSVYPEQTLQTNILRATVSITPYCLLGCSIPRVLYGVAGIWAWSCCRHDRPSSLEKLITIWLPYAHRLPELTSVISVTPHPSYLPIGSFTACSLSAQPTWQTASQNDVGMSPCPSRLLPAVSQAYSPVTRTYQASTKWPPEV